MQPFYLLLAKLLLAHFLTDFLLQPSKWVAERNEKHFASSYLYLHGICTAAVAWLLAGWQYWGVMLIILISHTFIDGVKSYLPKKTVYFVLDQLLHILVILACCFALFGNTKAVTDTWTVISANPKVWWVLAGFIFVTTPCGIFIGQFTHNWRAKLPDSESLSDAGKWIGILERILILVLVINEQYAGFGLLVAAKSILRFNEKDRLELKTEYVLVGTLLSISLAFFTGLLLKYLVLKGA